MFFRQSTFWARGSIFTLFLLLVHISYAVWPKLSEVLTPLLGLLPKDFGVSLLIALSWIFFAMFLMVLEAIDHRSLRYSKSVFLKGAVLWLIFYAISYFSIQLSGYLRDAAGITPLLNLNELKWFGVEVFLYYLFIDFFYYWFHRAQHGVKFLWRFHEFHHSIEDLTAANSTHHWTEEFFRILPFTLPIAFLFQGSTQTYVLISAFLASWGPYIHCNAPRAALPRAFKYLIVDNRFHFSHHGRAQKYHDKNFGAFIPLWDILFGTAYFEKEVELPKTGVEGKVEPSIIEYLKLDVPNKMG